ncbi:hypothetical protein LCM17_06675 [Cereibacter sphaeroides]|nr:hypothetical protein [Cereibacter sphaeroides]
MSFSLTIVTAEDIKASADALLLASFANLVDQHVEEQARALGYGSAASCAGYTASSVDTWATEARAFVAWRDAVWQAAFAQYEEHGTTGVVPTPEALIASLPVWSGVA